MLELLCDSELDNLDVRMLLLMKELKDQKILYTREELGKLLGVSVPTVTRRLKKFRERGLIKSIQLTHRVWKHLVYLPGQNQSAPERMPYPEKKPNHLDDSPLTEKPNHLDDASSPIIDLDNYRKKKYCNNIDPYAVSAEKKMAATGPKGVLADVISSSLEKTEQARRVKKEKRLAKSYDMSPERYETQSAKRHRRHEERTVEDYTVDDLILIFNEELKKAGYKGRPWKWTGKEMKAMKAMLTQQDPADVVEYVKHCVLNWDVFSRRYGLIGPPTIAAIYGYRKSWFLEFLNGETRKFDPDAMAEFDPEAAKKIPSGEWGF